MTAATLGTGKSLTGLERIGNEEAKEKRIQSKRRDLHFRVVDEEDSETSGEEKDEVVVEETSQSGARVIDDQDPRKVQSKVAVDERAAKKIAVDARSNNMVLHTVANKPLVEENGSLSGGEEEGEDEEDESGRTEDESKEEEGTDEEEESSGEEESDGEQSEEQDIVQRSRRRGVPSTGRSLGFKDWAREAMGLAIPKKSEEQDDDVYVGPEPVAGLSVKVKDLMDGKIRGPLGSDEPAMHERSAFAQKYYQERESRAAAAKCDSKGMTNKDRIAVHRLEDIEQARLMLPVLAEEETIVRTIMENMVTVLCGETGSGKTTQVPQFLFEAGFGTSGSCNPGMIGVTQPRRVAALSMASRVAKELNLPSSKVSHQIRYDATISPSTSIKFMTDGVLLRELAADFLLTRYSVIVIDEAHERSVNTDVLIGVLSRVVKLRAKRWIEGQGRPLRIVIMSATLRVEDFVGNSRLFDVKPPVIEIDARQYPVVNHFSRKTTHNYVEESVKKASKIHARLPPGGILIFLTGQAEISTVCRKLEKRYGKRALEARSERRNARSREDSDEEEGHQEEKVAVAARIGDVEAEEIDLTLQYEEDDADLALDVDDGRQVDADDVDALDTDEEEAPDYDADLPEELRDESSTPMHILPLYSLLPSDRQMKVFEPPPPNTRLVVVATNVAETSLTIPGITYVVDCGRSKERRYDAKTGVQSFQVGFISKASANQRAGRAGRTGPGHCYRLYSSNVYEEHFASFAEAEILRTPVDNLVLMMKAMNIDHVSNFPFPTPPEREALRRAEKLLLRLGALELDTKTFSKNSKYQITELGRTMSLFPLNSRLSKLLVQGHQFECLPYVIALVAALSVGRPFVQEESLHEAQESLPDEGQEEEHLDLPSESQHTHSLTQLDKERRTARRVAYFKVLNQLAALGGALSDPLQLLNAVGAYEHAGGTLQFCRENYLMPKAMQEIHKLRAQLSAMVQANAEPGIDWSHLSNPKFQSPPTSKQMTILRQFLTAAFIDQVAIRADLAPEGAARVPMLQETSSLDYRIAKQFQHQLRNGAKLKSTRDVAYLAMGVAAEACFIHRSSVLFHQAPPEWIIFSEVFRGQPRGDSLELPGKVWLKGVTKINANWIHKLGKSLCSFGKTVEVDQKSTRAKLIEAADEIKRRNKQTNASGMGDKQVFVVPSYGNGPACDIDERSSHVGWELPPVMARQRLVAGRWVTELA